MPAVWEVVAQSEDPNYYHWEEIRRRPPPKGLTREQWWLATKLRRQSQYHVIPLLDSRGVPFVYNVTSAVLKGLHRIDQEASGRIQGPPEQLATPEARDRYFVSSLIQEAVSSSQLEGAATTRQVAKDMIRAGRPPRDKSERMIMNNYLAMEQITKWGDSPLTPECVFDLHRILTTNTLDGDGGSGRFRRADERVRVEDDYGTVYHTPPPAEELEQRMAALCRFANDLDGEPFVPPVLRAIILHFWLAYDHPFVDGNGRTARALFYWAMRRYGYWLAEFISISHIILRAPRQYYRAFLYTETDGNDLTYFIHYHLQILGKAVEELHEYITRKTEELRALSSRMKQDNQWNARQKALISHALRHPGAEYTFKSHKNSHQVVYQTARSDLLGLQEGGLLVGHQVGKQMVFVPPGDLAERVASQQQPSTNS